MTHGPRRELHLELDFALAALARLGAFKEPPSLVRVVGPVLVVTKMSHMSQQLITS